MKRIVGSTVAVVSLVIAGSALGHTPSAESITSVIQATTFPSAAPFVEAYTGTFTSSTGDSGTETVQALFGAAPSPHTAVLQTLRTLTSNDGSSTLVLRCHQLATEQDLSTFPEVPSTGSCAVLSGTGVYAGVSGSGPLTGITVFDSSGSATLTDTVPLGR
jgi:hypothetical protein